MTRHLDVLDPGPYTSVQDLGRHGYRHLGVGRSGAADASSLRLANRLVGNPESSAVLECTLGGLHVRFDALTMVALTGAPCPAEVDGRTLAPNTPCYLSGGVHLRLGAPTSGLRTYLAVRGGIIVEPVLGSRSTDTLSGLGPEPPRAGTRLSLGAPPRTDVPVDVAPTPTLPEVPVLHVRPGPRDDWFTQEAMATLDTARYAVSGHSDRIGLRLEGPELARRGNTELASEPMVLGAVQVPPDGHPIVFGPDHPVTGGYPVIAAVESDDLPLLGQVSPGAEVRFRVRGN